jgi:hypothetical protein
MAAVVRGIVTERTERERVLVDVLRVTDQRVDEIAGADIVQEANT